MPSIENLGLLNRNRDMWSAREEQKRQVGPRGLFYTPDLRKQRQEQALADTMQNYPAFQPINPKLWPGPPGGDVRNPTERDNPFPGFTTITKTPSDAMKPGELSSSMKAELIHAMPWVDKNWAKMRQQFKGLLSEDQKSTDERAYRRAVGGSSAENLAGGPAAGSAKGDDYRYKENRSFEDWFDGSRLDHYIMEYLAPNPRSGTDRNSTWTGWSDKPNERLEGGYTPSQRAHLDKMNQYLQNPNLFNAQSIPPTNR